MSIRIAPAACVVALLALLTVGCSDDDGGSEAPAAPADDSGEPTTTSVPDTGDLTIEIIRVRPLLSIFTIQDTAYGVNPLRSYTAEGTEASRPDAPSITATVLPVGAPDGTMWGYVDDGVDEWVIHLDPATGAELERIEIDATPASLAVTDGGVYYAELVVRTADPDIPAAQLHRVDPAGGTDTVVLTDDVFDVRAGGGHLLTLRSDALLELDPATGTVLAEREAPEAEGLAVEGDLAVVQQAGGQLLAIDLVTGEIRTMSTGCDDVISVGLLQGTIWLACADGTFDGRFIAIDAATLTIAASVHVQALGSGSFARTGDTVFYNYPDLESLYRLDLG